MPMDTTTKESIEAGLGQIRTRVRREEDKVREVVKINLDLQLSGQEAVNYKVAKLFVPGLDDQKFVQQVLRVGLKTTTELVKLVAGESGIRL